MTNDTQTEAHIDINDTKGSQSKVLTVRMSPQLHDRLLTYKFFTKKSINELTVQLLADFLANAGADEIIEASARRTQSDFSIALEKLGE